MLVCSPGEIDKRLKRERELYDGRVSEALKTGSKVPVSEGAIIFDEIKVAQKLQWNSQNDSLVGYALNREEMSSLRDIYELLDNNYK